MTTLIDTCPSCGGSGLRPRQGTEADVDMHPILSKQGTLCERCGGSGKAKLTPEEIASRSK
jgi:hypothetical protein